MWEGKEEMREKEEEGGRGGRTAEKGGEWEERPWRGPLARFRFRVRVPRCLRLVSSLGVSASQLYHKTFSFVPLGAACGTMWGTEVV